MVAYIGHLRRLRILAEPDDTTENVPEDVRIYIEVAQYAECVAICQGADQVVLPIEQWERFCAEGMAAIMQLRGVRGG